MIFQPNLLIIGSTGRNTGKTEFACRIIEKHSSQKDIIGVKVIPVDQEVEKCHRGEEGCGLCDSLTGDFEIMEETSKTSPKDTSRMLKAGATRVYLLIIDRNTLDIGIEALLSRIPKNAMIIMESNTIRKAIKPGLFIVLKKLADTWIKPSCADVVGLADKIVEFDNQNWSMDLGNIMINEGRWVLKE